MRYIPKFPILLAASSLLAATLFSAGISAKAKYDPNGACYGAGEEYDVTPIGETSVAKSRTGWVVLEKTKAKCIQESNRAKSKFNSQYPSSKYKKVLIAKNNCPSICYGLPTTKPEKVPHSQ